MNSLFTTYYKFHNYLRSIFLLAGMLFLLSLIGWLLAGPAGIAWFLVVGVFVLLSGLHITPGLILRMYRAQVILPEDAPQLYAIINRLAKQAKLKNVPTLCYLPGRLINAFTTGLHDNVVIALSDGMLRQLNTRELTAVLAHEISHIHRNDLLVMLLADIMSRLTSIMAFTGYVLILVYIPLFLFTDAEAPWALLVVLMLAPSLSFLMQLALSRAHEYGADLEAARLTNDPLGLVAALEKIERHQGNWLERIFISSQRMREPALLRTHPFMIDRVKRLKNLASRQRSSDHPLGSDKKQNWGQFISHDDDPGLRFPWIWH